MGKLVARKLPQLTRRNFSRRQLEMTGWRSFSVWQFFGVSSRMLPSLPM